MTIFDIKLANINGEVYKLSKCLSPDLVDKNKGVWWPVWWIENEEESNKFKTLNNASNAVFCLDGEFAVNHSARKVIVGDIL